MEALILDNKASWRLGKMLDNRYEILEILGIGGMAVVYKAFDHKLKRNVAIKVLRDNVALDDEFRRRFRTEYQAVAMLSHPNIRAVYDVVSSGDTEYIVMEYVDGTDLKQYLKKKGRLPWKEALQFSVQIARALAHAHSKGIIHMSTRGDAGRQQWNGRVRHSDLARRRGYGSDIPADQIYAYAHRSRDAGRHDGTGHSCFICSVSVLY